MSRLQSGGVNFCDKHHPIRAEMQVLRPPSQRFRVRNTGLGLGICILTTDTCSVSFCKVVHKPYFEKDCFIGMLRESVKRIKEDFLM